jgi:hypothetical protein
MTLAERLAEYVRACFTGIYVRSHEHDDAITEIAGLCRQEGWSLATWDVDRGLTAGEGHAAGGISDPLAALRALPALGSPEGTAILVLRNFHRFLGSPEVAQALDSQIAAGKQARTFVVILAPVVQIPVELEKLLVVLEHDLPGRDQLASIASGVATEPGELPEGEALHAVLDASAGLTRLEAENAFSLSLVRHNRLVPEVLWEIKAGALKKSGLLTLHRGGETFADLGGLGALKAFCSRALRPGRKAGVRAKGVLLLGPPGSGKSAFARALGVETGRPTLILDVGSLLGSLVGQSEANLRQALRQVDAMSPCVVMVDEVEKALAGSTGPSGDSGVSARLFGNLLSWLNDREGDSFVVCTANDVSRLPPEFARSERFDATFFLDLPGLEERRAIWRMYVERFGLDASEPLPPDRDWTPAEIKACCRLSSLLEVPLLEAARNIVPVAVTAGESVERLRSWAAGRCLSAERPGLYVRATEAVVKPGRNVRRDPSSNRRFTNNPIHINPRARWPRRDRSTLVGSGDHVPTTSCFHPGVLAYDHASRPSLQPGADPSVKLDRARPAAPRHHGRGPGLVHLVRRAEDADPRAEGPGRGGVRRRGAVPLRREEAARHQALRLPRRDRDPGQGRQLLEGAVAAVSRARRSPDPSRRRRGIRQPDGRLPGRARRRGDQPRPSLRRAQGGGS